MASTGGLLVSLTSLVVNSVGIPKGGFGDGDTINLDYDDDFATVTPTKDGGAIVVINVAGYKSTCNLRIQVGSTLDKLFLRQISDFRTDISLFKWISINFTRILPDGIGGHQTETVVCDGGMLTKNASFKENVSGDVSAGIREYRIQFTNTTITIM